MPNGNESSEIKILRSDIENECNGVNEDKVQNVGYFFNSINHTTKYDRQDARRQVFIAICLNIGQIIIGYTVCWSAPVIQKLQDPERTPLHRPINDAHASWVAASMGIGVVAGSQSGAYLSNIVGRKPTLILSGLLLFTGNIIILMSKNFTTLIIGRVWGGLGAGGTACGNLVYIGEIASPEIRGILLTSTGVLHTLGGLLVFSVGPYVSYSVISYIVIVMTIVHVLGLSLIPESPVYHVIKGKYNTARRTLLYLGRSQDIDKELPIMIESVKDRRILFTKLQGTKTLIPRWNWLEIFRRRRNRKAFLITATLLIIQEGAGIACVMLFSTTIFRKAESSVNPDIATIILGVTQVFGILIAPLLVERFGRRTLLMFSTTTSALCMTLLGIYFYLELINHTIIFSIKWAPLATLVSFIFFYNAGLGIIPNVLVGEMFSPNVRSPGSSVAMCLGWIAGFVSSLSFGYIIANIGSHIIFVIFAILNALGCLFTLKVVPETKGKSLTEIEVMLAK